MLKDIENVQVVSFGWFNTWLNLNPGKIELRHILRSNCFEQVENIISSLFKGVCLWQLGWNIILGLLWTAEWPWRKKSHLPVVTVKKITHLCCPDEPLATKGDGSIASGGQGAHGDTPRARGSGELLVWPPKGAHGKPSFDTVRFVSLWKVCTITLSCTGLLFAFGKFDAGNGHPCLEANYV